MWFVLALLVLLSNGGGGGGPTVVLVSACGGGGGDGSSSGGGGAATNDDLICIWPSSSTQTNDGDSTSSGNEDGDDSSVSSPSSSSSVIGGKAFMFSPLTTAFPTNAPSDTPTGAPTTASPSIAPSESPSVSPVPTAEPTLGPTSHPTTSPSGSPSRVPSGSPSGAPSTPPSVSPTSDPSSVPSSAPSAGPSSAPSSSPSAIPSVSPSAAPSSLPSAEPSGAPSGFPSSAPTSEPTPEHSEGPTSAPTATPTKNPTTQPSAAPSGGPTSTPTGTPTGGPSSPPTGSPSSPPTSAPTGMPTGSPTASPSDSPTAAPTGAPTATPTNSPTGQPTPAPSKAPTTNAPCTITLSVSFTTVQYGSECEYDILNAAGDTVVTQDVTASNSAASYSFTHSIGAEGAETTDCPSGVTCGVGEYTLVGLDTYGDGWNGGSIVITAEWGDVYASGTVSNGDQDSGFRMSNAKAFPVFTALCDGSTGAPSSSPSVAPPPEDCVFAGVSRTHGSSWTDGCRTCECDDNEVFCMDKYKEVHALSESEMLDVANAFKGANAEATASQSNSEFTDFILGHNTDFSALHSNSWFLPFHRAYIAKMNERLQVASGNVDDGCLTLPWWDWTQDAGVVPANDGSTIPVFNENTFGTTEHSSTGFLSGSSENSCVHDGVLAGEANYWVAHDTQNAGSTLDTSEHNCLQRELNMGAAFASSEASTIASLVSSNEDYATFSDALESTPHSQPHVIIDGHMTTGLSPIDPVFFMHHNMVDEIWDEWQKKDNAAHQYDHSESTQSTDDAISIVGVTSRAVLHIERMKVGRTLTRSAGDSPIYISATFDRSGTGWSGRRRAAEDDDESEEEEDFSGLSLDELEQAPRYSMFLSPLSGNYITAFELEYATVRADETADRLGVIITQEYFDKWFDELRVWHGPGGGFGSIEFIPHDRDYDSIADDPAFFLLPTCGDDLDDDTCVLVTEHIIWGTLLDDGNDYNRTSVVGNVNVVPALSGTLFEDGLARTKFTFVPSDLAAEMAADSSVDNLAVCSSAFESLDSLDWLDFETGSDGPLVRSCSHNATKHCCEIPTDGARFTLYAPAAAADNDDPHSLCDDGAIGARRRLFDVNCDIEFSTGHYLSATRVIADEVELTDAPESLTEAKLSYIQQCAEEHLMDFEATNVWCSDRDDHNAVSLEQAMSNCAEMTEQDCLGVVSAESVGGDVLDIVYDADGLFAACWGPVGPCEGYEALWVRTSSLDSTECAAFVANDGGGSGVSNAGVATALGATLSCVFAAAAAVWFKRNAIKNHMSKSRLETPWGARHTESDRGTMHHREAEMQTRPPSMWANINPLHSNANFSTMEERTRAESVRRGDEVPAFGPAPPPIAEEAGRLSAVAPRASDLSFGTALPTVEEGRMSAVAPRASDLSRV